MDAWAKELAATPKQNYEAPAPEPPPAQPEPPPAPNAPAADAPPAEGGGLSEGSGKETARVFVMLYEDLKGSLCATFADHPDFPKEKFALEPGARKEIEQQLAKGMEANGTTMPWYVIVLMLVAANGVTCWLMVREARKRKEAHQEVVESIPGLVEKLEALKAEQARQRATPTSPAAPPVAPTSITTKEGTVIKPHAGAPLASNACQVCGNPTKPGRKYCSQACAGKATRKRPTT